MKSCGLLLLSFETCCFFLFTLTSCIFFLLSLTASGLLSGVGLFWGLSYDFLTTIGAERALSANLRTAERAINHFLCHNSIVLVKVLVIIECKYTTYFYNHQELTGKHKKKCKLFCYPIEKQ